LRRWLPGGCAETQASAWLVQDLWAHDAASGKWFSQKRQSLASEARHGCAVLPSRVLVTIRKIRSRISIEILLLPIIRPALEIARQYKENPALCHRTTVSGFRIMSACFQPDHNLLARTQKSLSNVTSRGLQRQAPRFQVVFGLPGPLRSDGPPFHRNSKKRRALGAISDRNARPRTRGQSLAEVLWSSGPFSACATQGR